MSLRTSLHRWFIFNSVGALGVVVQLAALHMFGGLGLGYLAATALAVETAVLHNFLWHERATWADRGLSRTDAFRRLLRFNIINGGISLVGNMAVMRLLVGALDIHPLEANLCAVALCSLATFAAADRIVYARRSDGRCFLGHARAAGKEVSFIPSGRRDPFFASSALSFTSRGPRELHGPAGSP